MQITKFLKISIARNFECSDGDLVTLEAGRGGSSDIIQRYVHISHIIFFYRVLLSSNKNTIVTRLPSSGGMILTKATK